MDIDNLERHKKTDEQIIDQLMAESKKGLLNWYSDNDYIYTRRIIKKNDTRVDILFKISDQLLEDEIYSEYAYYQDAFANMITLDIYMTKNHKKEIFIRRISSFQLKLSNLLEIVMPNVKKKPDNK